MCYALDWRPTTASDGRGKEERDYEMAGFNFEFLALIFNLGQGVIFAGNSCQSPWLRLITCPVILWVFVTSLIRLCNAISLPNLPNLHIAGSAHVPRLISVPDPDVEPISDRMEATFAGPIGSAYEGGIFKVLIKIPADYPFRCGSKPVWAWD